MAFIWILAFNYDNLRGKHLKNLKEVTGSPFCQSTQTTPLGRHGSLYNIIACFFNSFWVLVCNLHKSALGPSQAFFSSLCVLETSCSSKLCPKGGVVKLPYMREMLTSWCIALLSGEWQSLSSFAHTDPYRYLSYDNVFLQDEHSFITC